MDLIMMRLLQNQQLMSLEVTNSWIWSVMGMKDRIANSITNECSLNENIFRFSIHCISHHWNLACMMHLDLEQQLLLQHLSLLEQHLKQQLPLLQVQQLLIQHHLKQQQLQMIMIILAVSLFIGPESDHCLPLSVTDWLTHWLTDWLLFSKLDWCDSGLWRCQLKTCWGFYCCWCWWWGSCWQQLVADMEAEVWS